MRPIDRLLVSIRHIRGRLVESILVVLATAVGVALVASMAAFIRSYDEQTEYLLSHPAYRELIVEAVGNETELDEPAVEYDPDTTSEASLGYDDIQVALENTSLVTYGYLADREQLSTQLPGSGRFSGRGMAAAGGVALGDSSRDPAAGAGEAGVELPFPPPGTFPPPTDMTDAAEGDGAARGDGAGSGGSDNPFAAIRKQMEDAAAAGEEPPEFNLDQFFQVDDDVLTELPLESFPGRRVSAEFFEAYGLAVAEGSEFTNEDLESGNQVIVLGSSLADALFPDGDALGTRIRLNLQTYTVIGVLSPTTLTDTETDASYNDVAYVPNAAAQVNFGGNVMRFHRPAGTLRFAVDDSANLDLATAELQAHFGAEYGDGAVRITAPLEELQTEREKLSRILSVVLFLAAAGLFIASINLFNLMLMRVIKRTKGIGITRALGATRREIARQFLNESAFMSLTGAVIGLAVSPFVYRLLQSALIAEVSAVTLVNWPFLLVGALGAFLFSLIFGVYPALQAGRIDAALAIRSE
ncbi:MAG: ABC transporter permease [Spirochaetales bacterium]|nr:ABC transporter permease [Spirochaetales bacterium]